MTRTWIDPIYDRSYGDIQSVQYDPDQEAPKGCWNAVDLNRVEKNTAYCAEWMLEKKIIRSVPSIVIREDDYWTGSIIPTKEEIDRVINNVRVLVLESKRNPAIADQLPNIYAATQPNYVLANQIEFALDLMHNQPKLPLEYWPVKIENGIVVSVIRDGGETEIINASEALVAENEIVTIKGVEYGEYAQYQTFTYWSGAAEDIGLLENYEAQQTTFEMPYGREIDFTANFLTHIPRSLKINNGYISPDKDPTDETGPSTGTYFAGDEVMIIANRASSGKAFYEWTGTEEALGQIVGVTYDEDPSTAILTMPDCDVELTPFYINAGKHRVTVNSGYGSGLYDYKDYVSISPNTPSHYRFSYWSGNTSYLSDIYSGSQSFRMGDINISFTAHFDYVYSYNDVQMIDGLIRINGQDVDQAEGLRERSSQTLVPTPPDNTQGLDYWAIEGAGSIETDVVGNHTNTFIVGDGNAIITGHYNTLRTLRVSNKNNNGVVTTSSVVQGHRVRMETNEIVGDYIFVSWTRDGSVVSSSTRYDFTMPEGDVSLTANYRLRNTVNVTIDYGSHTETIQMQERATKSITADPPPSGKNFVQWITSGLYNIVNRNSSSTTITAGSGNATVTATYELQHRLTVNGGTGSGMVKEGTGQTIDATQAPATYEFDYWEIISGNGTIDNIYSKRTTFRMNTTDAEITAHYKPIPYFTVTMENGYIWDGTNWVTQVTILRDSTNAIKMKPAPTGKQFAQWEVYVNGALKTDANDVYEPLAEQTRLNGLFRDITIKATYYIPDPTVLYTLTIERKDGHKDQNQYQAGRDVTITASWPDEGMEFHRWEGDVAYVAGGITQAESYVHMPAQNIEIREVFVPEGYKPEFKIQMVGLYAECCYETSYEDPETHEITITEHWTTVYEHYHQGDVVKIRSTGFDVERYFNAWGAWNNDTEEDARSVITSLNEPNTTLIMPDFNLDIQADVPLKQTYQLTVNEGGSNGWYYEGKKASIYFGKENTNDVHYEFTRWVNGMNTQIDVSQLRLFEGGMFNVRVAGDAQHPQQIAMPNKRVELSPTYDTLYRLTITGGTIDGDEPQTEGFYKSGSHVNITADPAPTGMRFQYWEGDTGRLLSKYDPTTVITTTAGTTTLRAVYSTDADRNGIGYAELDLRSESTVDIDDIHIIAGQIETGFILTDSLGHIYLVISVDQVNNTCTIYRMTKIVEGGNIYG